MLGEAMKRICIKAIADGEPLSTFRALEFFARQGDWQTQSYANIVSELHAWEIDSKHEDALRKNLPMAHVRIGDSFEISHEEQYRYMFDWLVLDNPQMIYGNYCEHFEALDLSVLLLNNISVVIFNVNKKPFNYAMNPEWQLRRKDYYGRDATILESDYLLEFYRDQFSKLGFVVRYMYEVPRNSEYLSYIVAGVRRDE